MKLALALEGLKNLYVNVHWMEVALALEELTYLIPLTVVKQAKNTYTCYHTIKGLEAY